MENDEEATNAMNELDGSSIRGREIVVKQAEEKPRAKRW
jgi:RNA recognition motif-containing protein